MTQGDILGHVKHENFQSHGADGVSVEKYVLSYGKTNGKFVFGVSRELLAWQARKRLVISSAML